MLLSRSGPWNGAASYTLPPGAAATRCYDVRVQLELDARRDLDLVAGLESLGLERADHADPPQPALEVGQRVLVVEVVAGDQPLDALRR